MYLIQSVILYFDLEHKVGFMPIKRMNCHFIACIIELWLIVYFPNESG